MTTTERVANFLLELAARHDVHGNLDIPMSRNDIADNLGLTIETVYRELSAFKRNGMIAMCNPHRIEISDRDALQEAGGAERDEDEYARVSPSMLALSAPVCGSLHCAASSEGEVMCWDRI